MSKKNFDTPIPDEEMYETNVPVEEPLPKKTPMYGRVNCERLNIRSKPQRDKDNSNVLCVVDIDAKLLIDEEKSNVIWYAVTTETGIDGYCMKKFVTVAV